MCENQRGSSICPILGSNSYLRKSYKGEINVDQLFELSSARQMNCSLVNSMERFSHFSLTDPPPLPPIPIAFLQAVCGCGCVGEFAIAGAILDARENWSGASDQIFARVQDGAGDGELRVFRGFSAIKTPTNRLQAGYHSNLYPYHDHYFLGLRG